MERMQRELSRLREAIEHGKGVNPLKVLALKKIGNCLRGIESPGRETLDRLSLLAGFQDWESFRKALHGDADASINYDDGDKDAMP